MGFKVLELKQAGLRGRHILVTRAAGQFDPTAHLIEQKGAHPIAFPCLEMQTFLTRITQALAQLDDFSDILFTSANGVHAVASCCKPSLAECLREHRIAVVGSKTAEALLAHGIQAHIIPEMSSQAGLIETYQKDGRPQSLLFFRAEEGSDLLSETLQASGVRIATIFAYGMRCPQDPATEITTMLQQQKIDAVLLGSAKTAQYYLQRIQDLDTANQTCIVVMSQQVADAADKLGLQVQIIARQASFATMLDDLEHYFSQRSCSPMSSSPLTIRPRRLRQSAAIRRMVRETSLSSADFIYPLFVDEGISEPLPVKSMPGVSRLPLADIAAAVKAVKAAGIPGIIFFGIPKDKDAIGSGGWDDDGIVQQAIRAAKEACPNMCVIADSCFCEYTDHGHCGVLCGETVDNDVTLENLKKEAVSYAKAGVDIVAPSGMMDGMTEAIRSALDEAGFSDTLVMPYAVKYASGYFGPFRDAADSTPSFGDRTTYQMDPGNRREAIREALLDVEEGADMLIVKPAMAYMDIIHEVKEATQLPIAVYNVSGEYAMVKAAAANDWIDEKRVVLETMLGFKRAGADIIISYHALDVARWLNEE